jgi:hypothetical protein
VNELTTSGPGRPRFAPQTLSELLEFAKLVADSALVPQEYRGRPADIVVAVQTGAELGLSPLQSLTSVSVINGKPSVWGDGALALVRASGLLEDFAEGVEGTGDAAYGYCRLKRKGQATPIEKRFSVADAKRATLWGRRGPWSQYPQRMLVMRARGFALRDGFADALKGLITREEAGDFPTVDEQAKAPESDLPWTTRLSERGKAKPAEVDISSMVEDVEQAAAPDEDLTATLEASIKAATEGTAPTPDADLAGDPGVASESPEDGAVPSPPDPVPPPWEDEPVLINQQDRKRFHACRTEGKHSEADTKKWLLREYGITTSSNIQQSWLPDICRRLKDPASLV